MRRASRDSQSALWRESLAAMSLGWDLAIPIFGGALLGHLLDRWRGTGYAFTLGLLLLGVGAGFYNVIRFARRVELRGQGAVAPNDDASEDAP